MCEMSFAMWWKEKLSLLKETGMFPLFESKSCATYHVFFSSWLPGSSESNCMLNHHHQIVSFFLYLCSLFFLLIPFFLLTFSFVSLVDRGLSGIWTVVGRDEISKYKSKIYKKNLSFEPYLFHLLK